MCTENPRANEIPRAVLRCPTCFEVPIQPIDLTFHCLARMFLYQHHDDNDANRRYTHVWGTTCRIACSCSSRRPQAETRSRSGRWRRGARWRRFGQLPCRSVAPTAFIPTIRRKGCFYAPVSCCSGFCLVYVVPPLFRSGEIHNRCVTTGLVL